MAELKSFTLAPENNFRFRAVLRWDDTADGVNKPRTGLTLEGLIAATDDPAATEIHASLKVSLTEVAGKGIYLGSILGSAVTAQLNNAPYWDKTVYAIVRTSSGSIRAVVAVVLRKARYAENV